MKNMTLRPKRWLSPAAVSIFSAVTATAQVGHVHDASPNNLDWAAAIVLAGETPVHVVDLATFDLGTIEVLCVNVGQSGPSPALLARVPELSAWVQAGGALVYHDRSLQTSTILPGGGAVSLSVAAAGDIDVATAGTAVTSGPGGTIDDTTLDSWTATTHGFASQLPSGAIDLLSNGASTGGSTAFCYPHGAGLVYYAPMPLDFYQAGLGPVETQAAMNLVYAPNVVAYAARGGGTPFESLCPGEVTACPCSNAGAPGHGCANSAAASGARLVAAGFAGVGHSTLELRALGLVPQQPGLLFQGTTAVNGGAGAPFGDGLRCAGSGIVRLEVLSSDAAGVASSTVDLGSAGGVAAGDSRIYQLWYRDAVGSPCVAGFNTTNGARLSWVP